MKIKYRLSLLFVAGALLPLLTVTIFHYISMRGLGTAIGQNTRERLTTIEYSLLEKTVNDYNRILKRDRKIAEIAVNVQARAVEKLLAADAPPAEPIYFPEDFQRHKNPVPGMTLSYKYLDKSITKQGDPVWVNFKHAVVYPPPEANREIPSADLARLSALTDDYRFVYRIHPELIFWQHTTLQSGAHSDYPGHSCFPSDFNPLEQDWYQITKQKGTLTWMTSKDTITAVETQVVAKPVYYPDGSFAGITSLHIPFEKTFQALQLPYPLALSQEFQVLLLLYEQNNASGEERLKILAQRSSLGKNNLIASKKEQAKLYIKPNGSSQFQDFLKEAATGKPGLKKISHRGRDFLYAFGSHEKEDPFPLIILPYSQIETQARALQSLVQEKTVNWLKIAIMGLFGAIFLSTLLAFISANTVIKPLMKLASAAIDLSKGNYSSRVDIHSRDELQALGSVFNTMGPRLKENERMQHALAVAKETQQYLLPDIAPRLKHYDITGTSIYSDETGGDYYDFIEFEDEKNQMLGIAVGDVSGHGLGAALLMASARGIIRSHASSYPNRLHQFFERLNHQLLTDTKTDQFITLFYGILDVRNHSLTYVSAGHDPAIWIQQQNNEYIELPNTGMPLGVSEEAQYKQEGPIYLQKGDIISICTDGIWEARNPKKDLFGKERLIKIISENAHKSTKMINTSIMDALQSFQEGSKQKDDQSIVLIKREND